MQPNFQHVPLAQLRVSATLSQIERRQHLDKGGINELAESIATVGILQPLVVRPISRSAGLNYLPTDPTHEIVAGERRFLAAKVAKLETVPVNVRDLTDEQVIEIQLVENLQRVDVHPMAEAEGYEALRKLGRKVEEFADKVGKSKAYIYGRMKLLDLVKECRTAFYAGKLTPSTALYLARVPMGLQLQALKEITHDRFHGPMSAREVQQYLQREFMLRLSDAPFDTKDATLLPNATACAACPKRSGNNPDLFGDVTGTDVCTDPVCYRGKVKAHLGDAIRKAAADGMLVIGAAEAKKIAPHGLRSSMKGFVRLDAETYTGNGFKTYRQILGKAYKPTTVIVDEQRGELVQVVPEKDLPKETRSKSSGGGSGRTTKADTEKERQKKEGEKRSRAAIFRAVLAAAPAKVDRATLQELVEQEIDNSGGPDEEFFELMGKPGFKGSVPAYLKSLNDTELARLAAVAKVIGEACGTYGDGSDLKSVAKRYGVDAKKIKVDVLAALKAEAKAAAPAKKKAGKK